MKIGGSFVVNSLSSLSRPGCRRWRDPDAREAGIGCGTVYLPYPVKLHAALFYIKSLRIEVMRRLFM